MSSPSSADQKSEIKVWGILHPPEAPGGGPSCPFPQQWGPQACLGSWPCTPFPPAQLLISPLGVSSPLYVSVPRFPVLYNTKTLDLWLLSSLSVVSDSLATSWTHQVPPSVGFSRQEYCSQLPLPPPGESSRLRDRTHGLCVSCTSKGDLHL